MNRVTYGECLRLLRLENEVTLIIETNEKSRIFHHCLSDGSNSTGSGAERALEVYGNLVKRDYRRLPNKVAG